MSEGYTKSMELLKKFSGKTKDIELTNDDGESIKIKMYPLPNKNMAEMLESQKYASMLPHKKIKVGDKEIETVDENACTSEERVKLYEMNRKIVSLSIAHSMKKMNGDMTDAEFSEVSEFINNLPASIIQQTIVAISGLNEVPLTESDSK